MYLSNTPVTQGAPGSESVIDLDRRDIELKYGSIKSTWDPET